MYKYQKNKKRKDSKVYIFNFIYIFYFDFLIDSNRTLLECNRIIKLLSTLMLSLNLKFILNRVKFTLN
jgi:hypothetical protein